MKTLVVDKQYQPLRFVDLRDCARYLIKEKVEVMATWDEHHVIYGGQLYPATVRLKEYIRKKPRIPRFNKKALFRRDNFICQYTGLRYPPSKLTIDHVFPKSRGGKLTWDNCVTACLEINALKGDRTPGEAGLKLLNQPKPPAQPLSLEYSAMINRHDDWSMYF